MPRTRAPRIDRDSLAYAMRHAGYADATQLARAAGMRPDVIRSYLDGFTARPRPMTVLGLADALGVEPADLVTYECASTR